MILVFDIGNSRVKAGGFSDGEIVRVRAVPSADMNDADSFDALAGGVARGELITGCCFSSVSPAGAQKLREWLDGRAELRRVEISAKTYPYRIGYETPETLGPDRLCDAVAGFRMIQGPCLVVDFGTAVTFNLVGGYGEFLGGAIAAGSWLMSEALARRAARLPTVPPDFPRRVIARTTSDSIASGITYGLAALVDGMVDKIEAEFGAGLRVISTGGAGMESARRCRRIEGHYPNLTLEGAALMAERILRSS